jgi:hypothetical protein
MAECNGCGNKAASRIRAGFFTNEQNKREHYEYCDRCGDIGIPSVPDVYFDGKPEHGLPDNPKTGKPYEFSSKFEKARFLKDNHLKEAGDTVHGSMVHHTREHAPKDNAREVANRALSHVKQMGADYRREQYLKIVRDSQNNR